MKKIFLLIILAGVSSLALAEQFQDQIHSVAAGKKGEQHLLFLGSGRVVFVDSYFEPSDFGPGDRVELEVDENLTLESINSLPPLEAPLDAGEATAPMSYEPTILPDFESAKNIFSTMNRSYKSQTECTDRAHVWVYEEWKKHNLKSNKVFVFFTNTYIRKYRFNWWFHVSPYTLASDGENVIEYVMDRRFTSTPYQMQQWTDVFIRSKKNCPEKSYAHYRANKNGPEHCFVTKTSMYYRLPYHVRQMEDNGIIKNSFSSGEVNFSYRAFNRRY